MATEIMIYITVFIIGFMAGRIVTTIQLGIRYDKLIKSMKKKYSNKK